MITEAARVMRGGRIQPVPGLAPVHVREMTAADMIALQKLAGSGIDTAVHVVAVCACDDTGQRIYDGDTAEVMELPWRVIESVSRAALDLNGLGEDQQPGN